MRNGNGGGSTFNEPASDVIDHLIAEAYAKLVEKQSLNIRRRHVRILAESGLPAVTEGLPSRRDFVLDRVERR
jgi:hypothetical protein